MGDKLGLVGLSGLTEMPHLHFTVRRGGSYINPVTMLEGANQGGGTFTMHPDLATVPEGEGTMQTLINPFIQNLADTISGGQRQDHRELRSLDEEEPPIEKAPSLGQRIADGLGIR